MKLTIKSLFLLLSILTCFPCLADVQVGGQIPTDSVAVPQDSIAPVSDFLRDLQKENQINDSLRVQLAGLVAERNQKQKQLNGYYIDLIDLASNFLFLPYNKVGIEQIALPAMMTARSYADFDRYMPRVELLRSYDKDQASIKKFLEENKNKPSDRLNIWSANFIRNFNNLDAVKRYKALGSGWEGTYLGKYINDILTTVSGKDAKAINKKLHEIYNKL